MKYTLSKFDIGFDALDEDITDYDCFLTYNILIFVLFLRSIDIDRGIEYDLIPKAKEMNINILELETIEQQKNPLNELSILRKESFSDMFIQFWLDGLERQITEWDDEFEHYKSQLTKGMRSDSKMYMDGDILELHNRLDLDDGNEKRKLNKRNLNMALKIDELIQNSDERYMFAPGSAHCIGKFGMVSLLEGMGYKAERIIIHEPQ